MNLLITGATGFVGSAFLQHCLNQNANVIAAVRAVSAAFPATVKQVAVGDLSASQDWSTALQGVDVVVHLAARAHIMKDSALNPLEVYREANTYATLNLAQQAAKAGVKRFVFMSTVNVCGMTSDKVHDECCSPFGETPAAISKYEAEQGLTAIAAETGMEVVIFRPPLVYGQGVKGNFASMVRWVQKGVPLPLGAVHNQRSLVALDNLVNFIELCCTHPKAANETFLIADGVDVSTTELLYKVAQSLGVSPRLIPVPVAWMRFAAKLLGKEAVANRLFGNLQVDASKARELLGWQPVVTMQQQLDKMRDKLTTDN